MNQLCYISKRKVKHGIICAFISLCPLISFAQTATTPNVNNQPISIDADNQQIDIKQNTITFSGNVVVTQNDLKVNANRMVISEFQSNDEQLIKAYGKPVYFEQIDANNPQQNITGHAEQLVYSVPNNEITLIGNAEIIQKDNRIKGENITYNIGQQKISATATKGSRVKTLLIPNQVKELK